MTPSVSILLLTYNHKEFIGQAIDSVLEQKVNFDYEILIGDDCSTDGTCEIVDIYVKNYPNLIKTIRSKQNVGALRNEKRLMEDSIGKYIAFLEGDDFWVDPLKLQKQVNFLETNPDYGLVHADVDHYYENTGKTEKQVNKVNKIKIPQGNVFSDLLKPDPLFIKTATVCFRKELALKHFNYELAIKENWPLTDLPLWMDITYHSKTHYFDEVFATYRLLNESASRTQSPEKQTNYIKKLYALKLHYLKKYNCNDIMRSKLETDHFRNLIKMAFNLNDNTLAKESINALKEKGKQISMKEQIMFISTKNNSLRKFLKLMNTAK